MVTPRQYASAGALRTALEARLLERAKRRDEDLQRLRRQVAFDRLLARLFGTETAVRGWVLKGGYALELRFRHARATRDLDLTVTASGIGADSDGAPPAMLHGQLVRAALARLQDFFVFEIGDATLELDQAPEGGARFPVDARLDGRSFVTFHVDVGVGDAVLEPVDEIAGEDWLGFAGIAPSVVPALSLEQHWAEKLHAYSRPREGRPNTRVKDLVDLVLLIERERLSGDRVRASVAVTFGRRRTHDVPQELPPPPSEWNRPFAALAAECQLAHTPETAHATVVAFWRRVRG
jgi:hypothetical protein